MQDLIERLTASGLTEAQAHSAVGIVKDFTKEKFPMFADAIDKLFEKYKPGGDDFLD